MNKLTATHITPEDCARLAELNQSANLAVATAKGARRAAQAAVDAHAQAEMEATSAAHARAAGFNLVCAHYAIPEGGTFDFGSGRIVRPSPDLADVLTIDVGDPAPHGAGPDQPPPVPHACGPACPIHVEAARA